MREARERRVGKRERVEQCAGRRDARVLSQRVQWQLEWLHSVRGRHIHAARFTQRKLL